MSFLDNLKKETTVGRTENGAVTFTSSLNHNLDFYAQAGAIRSRLEDASSIFSLAYGEDKELALRNLMYLRDVRGGLGEREAFRQMMKNLVDSDSSVAKNVLIYIPFIGRWDDLVEVYAYAKSTNKKDVSEEAIKIIKEQLNKDIDNAIEGKTISLMAKWIPSPSVKSKKRKAQANMIAFDLGIKVSQYRKCLSLLRKHIGIVETKLTERNYGEIEFETLPSRALFKYRQAFYRNMESKYEDFINRVNNGEIKMNASNVLPYEIIREYTDEYSWYNKNNVKEYNPVLEATWKSLNDVIGDMEENAIVVADTSASMTGDPWFVAQSLAIYCAERLEGAFKNHFITFSTKPSLVELPKDSTLRDKLVEYNKNSIVSNTDIEKVFSLILNTAIKHNTPQEELPTKIIIVSDMEFDYMTDNADETAFENAKRRFEEAGYKLPNIVFWNVASRQDNLPVRHNEQGVAMVSGLTPNIFKTVLLNEFVTPEQVMLDTIMSERYDFVVDILSEENKTDVDCEELVFDSIMSREEMKKNIGL